MDVMSEGVVPPRAVVPLGSQALRTVSNVAAIGSSSGSVEDRVNLILEELKALVPYGAAMLAGTDPSGGTRRSVVASGYSRRLREYMLSAQFRLEMLDPFAHELEQWPIRECDLPVDPLSVRAIAEHLRPEGHTEGMLMRLVGKGGAAAGFLIISVPDSTPPTDEAITAIAHVGGVLGNLVDPLRDARWLSSMLAKDQTAVAILPDQSFVTLQGTDPPDLAEPASSLRRALSHVSRAAIGADVPFTWLDDEGRWFSCRLLRCRDSVTVLTISESAQRYGLTRRELEVLTHVSLGRTNDEIAAELVVTTRTVRAHVERVMDKLNVASRSGVASRALREGLTLPAILAG
ncbi:MAG: helix-turn-helix transcriptional regulator [Marmoricola sp.]|jgi:DNA-binding CsgD family transcriptional regulator|nr:helix-turn-helix transcriptional regulator [Marmoricola sp.]